MKFIIFILALLLACNAQAKTYKCKREDGSYIYQQIPCADDMQLEKEFGKEYRNPIYDEDITDRERELIQNKKVGIGMSKKAVELSWGKPDNINRSIGEYGVHEQWVYRNGHADDQYIYIKNGIVTSMSD